MTSVFVPPPAARTVTYREVEHHEPYKCPVCKARVTDGMGCVAVVDGEAVDGVCCCENCAEKNAEKQ